MSDAWKKFRRYFRLIGPGSHVIRRVLLAQLERELGTPDATQNDRTLPGDDLVPDAIGQFTHSIVISAPPDKIWPWLVQMGCQRAGFYSIDLLDNAGIPSAREIRLDLQQLRIGDTIAATPSGDNHFEVLRIEQNRALLLGGLFDVENQKQVAFGAPRPHQVLAYVMGVRPGAAGRRANEAVRTSARCLLSERALSRVLDSTGAPSDADGAAAASRRARGRSSLERRYS